MDSENENVMNETEINAADETENETECACPDMTAAVFGIGMLGGIAGALLVKYSVTMTKKAVQFVKTARKHRKENVPAAAEEETETIDTNEPKPEETSEENQ